MDYYAAGILPYIKIDDTTYFLLGKDKRHKWSDFGGKSETRDNNNPKNTAIREFYEETCGCISSLHKIQYIMNNTNIICLRGKSYTKKEYYMFLLDLKYVLDSDELYNSLSKFNDHHRFLKKENVDPKYTEKTNLNLISTDILFKTSSFNYLRQVFHNTINIENNKNIIKCV